MLVSAEDGILLAGEVGERLLGHYSFYSAFATPEEFRIISDGRTLGTLPVDFPIQPDSFIIFAARRWKVIEVDEKAKTISVVRSSAGKAPLFGNEGIFGTRREIRQRMRALYESDTIRPYQNAKAREMMEQGRVEYRALQLDRKRAVREGGDIWLFLWEGDYVAATLSLALANRGIASIGNGTALELKGVREEDVEAALDELSRPGKFPTDLELAKLVANKQIEKHDVFLGDTLLEQEYAAKVLDRDGAIALLDEIRNVGNSLKRTV